MDSIYINNLSSNSSHNYSPITTTSNLDEGSRDVNNRLNVTNKNKKFQYIPKQVQFNNKLKKNYVTRMMKESKKKVVDRLGIVCLNAHSAQKKMLKIEALADQMNAHVVAITETWFASDINYKLENFEHVISKYSDKKYEKYGGCSIYIRRDIVHNFLVINLANKLLSEDGPIIGVESKKLKLKIFCTYRSPNMSSQGVQIYLDDLKKLDLENTNNWYVVGDLNMPSAYGAGKKPKCTGSYVSIFHYFESLGVYQPIDDPTHYQGNTLDLFLCSPTTNVIHAKVLSASDFPSPHYPIHMVVELDTKIQKIVKDLKRRVTDWANADLDGYRAQLRRTEYRLLEIVNFRDNPNFDIHLVATRVNQFIIQTWNDNVQQKWVDVKREIYSPEVKEQIFKLKEISKNYHRRTVEVRRESRKLSLMIKHDNYARAQERLRNIAESSDYLYKYYDQINQGERRVGPYLNKETGKFTENDQEAVDLLSTHYSSVWIKDDKIDVDPYTPPSWWTNDMEPLDYDKDIEIHEWVIRSALMSIRRKVGYPEQDGVSGYMLKEGLDYLVSPLTMMMKNMVFMKTWPKPYKEADVTPLPKDGDKSNVSNTRPISMCALIGKTFEKTLGWRTLRHLRTFQGGRFNIKSNQYGFYPRRSVNDNLCMFLNKIMIGLDASENQDVVLLDMSKAFDRLKFNLFLRNLKECGIVGKEHDLWRSWLTDGRTQRVKVGDCVSEVVNLTSSCVQGSSLGPLAFLILVNPAIPDEIGINGKLKKDNDESERIAEKQKAKLKRIRDSIGIVFYADDAKLYGNAERHMEIQAHLDRLGQWSLDNEMIFNVSKCETIHLGSTNKKHVYTLYGQPIPSVSSTRDLGLHYEWLNGKLSFQKTVDIRYKKCMKILKLSRSIISINHNSINQFVIIYQTYVFPQLFTFSEFFFTESKEECKMVDDFYRRFFSNLSFSVSDLKTIPHPPSVMLKVLARSRFWKCAQGLTGVDAFDAFTFTGTASQVYNRSFIQKPLSKTGKYDKLNFCTRYIDWYNGLPRDIGRNVKRFDDYINDEQFILTNFYNEYATKARNDLITGRLCDIGERRRMHIAESLEASKRHYEEIRRHFNEKMEKLELGCVNTGGASCVEYVDAKTADVRWNGNASAETQDPLSKRGKHHPLFQFEDLTLENTWQEDESAREYQQESEASNVATKIPTRGSRRGQDTCYHY